MDMPEWMEKSPHGLNPTQRTIGNNDKLGAEEMVALPMEKHAY